MKLLVAIPSKGRSDTIFKHTLRWATRLGYDVKIFVEPSEIEAYQNNAKDANYHWRLNITDDQFIDIGRDNGGLGFVKQFIKDYALQNEYDLVFKLDDDVSRFNARGRNKPDDKMVMDVAAAIGTCRKAMSEYPDVAAIGFPYRNELFEPKTWVGINKRLQSCYIIRTPYLLGGFNTFEDFAQFIFIRKQNKVTLRYGLLGMDIADVGKNRGGLQLFDRAEQAKEEMQTLRDMWPSLQFRKVDKAWGFEPIMKGFGEKGL